jgi:hypothetical protein
MPPAGSSHFTRSANAYDDALFSHAPPPPLLLNPALPLEGRTPISWFSENGAFQLTFTIDVTLADGERSNAQVTSHVILATARACNVCLALVLDEVILKRRFHLLLSGTELL